MRLASVELCDPPQSPQHVAKVTAEHASVGVQLVDDDIAQVFKQPRPPRVVRQNPRVQHVRIGQDDVALLADGFARVARRVPVISEHAEPVLQPLVEVVQLRQLILRQRFSWKKVEGARIRIGQNGIQNGQVVAQGFAAGCRRHDDDVFPGMHRFGRRGLVGIQLPNPLGFVRSPQILVNPSRKFRPLSLPRGIVAHRRQDLALRVAAGEIVENLRDTRQRSGSARRFEGRHSSQTHGQGIRHKGVSPAIRLFFAQPSTPPPSTQRRIFVGVSQFPISP